MYPSSKRKLDVRLFLWGLFLLQIALICLFLLFGTLLVTPPTDDISEEIATAEQRQPQNAKAVASSSIGQVWSSFGVRFISHGTSGGASPDAGTKTAESNSPLLRRNFSQGEKAPHGEGFAYYHGDAIGQLLDGKQHPRHPKYRPWIQRALPAPMRANLVFRTVSYPDLHGLRRRKLCFIEGTRRNATIDGGPLLQQPTNNGSSSRINETELQDTGMPVTKAVEAASELINRRDGDDTEDEHVFDAEGSIVAVGEDGLIGRCRCNAQWHGADCGQPEVIWRAFITSKIAAGDRPVDAPRKLARNVIYIVQSTFVSIEVLEIQLMELYEQVSLFVLCDRHPVDPSVPSQKDFSFADHYESTDFLRSLHHRLLIVSDVTCSGRNVFRKVQKYSTKASIRPDDIVLVSGRDEILNRKAVAYLRWYDDWPQPVRFRLKHNVYGFFWQHATNRTVIGSAAVQVSTLREVYASDPDRLLLIDKPVMLIGDLNHFGGWFCRRCYQPGSVVRYFEQRAALYRPGDAQPMLYLPDPKRTTVLNEAYVQQLIASGKDLEDGERPLERISQRMDHYYQPEYVRENSWKFDNIVLNLYARWEDSIAEDDYLS
ncbi:beta-1,4-mannosyl-glycoprotein 4-beta-N-acetylglucosaminyltransferase-like [Anopheles albimanus]|uniref:Beta-1,4-mannosyl-glycoprotein 4-beta-N-acetylglucosaminyltransferase n=1 Tax=Anopheles albimanus TaxID=7167 RepID=A0A182F4W3_ANOAL|nr:beta-1,4-mannosyl-glycoprotein 4-beta-N-acetylglucosaminyltransferase-like [Anopheles albimanus]